MRDIHLDILRSKNFALFRPANPTDFHGSGQSFDQTVGSPIGQEKGKKSAICDA